MKTGEAVVLFEDTEVRKEWIDGEWWIPSIDVAKALGYSNPSRAAGDMSYSNSEALKGYEKIVPLLTQGGRQKVKVLNLQGVIIYCMKSNQPGAVKFQRWAAETLRQKIEEIPTDIRLVAKTKRVKFTDELQARGIKQPKEYQKITMDMKSGIGIDRYKPKASCDLIEVMKIAVAEDLARINMIQKQAEGFVECHQESVKAAVVIGKNTTLAKSVSVEKETK